LWREQVFWPQGRAGQVLGEEGHYPEAERVLREDYDSLQRVLEQDHKDTAASAYELALCMRPSSG